MHGVFIDEGLSDWQIVQQEQGTGTITLSGHWIVPQAAINVGVAFASPIIRVMSESDNSQLIPWTKTERTAKPDGLSGEWSAQLRIPAGGLYRVETGLDTKSTDAFYGGWIFRGDVKLHIGVGDIFVVAGQSNSAGYGKDSAYDPPALEVHVFRNRGCWDLATHPLNESTGAADMPNAEMGVSGTSPYLSFGKNFSRLTGYPVGLIVTALGGTPIERWDREEKGDLFENMLQKIKICGSHVAGVLWYQGCNDANDACAPYYPERFKRVVEDLRKELGYAVPFFTYQLNRQIGNLNDRAWGQVREAQRRAAHEIERVTILPTLNCTVSDAIHNNSHSNVLLGEKMAKQCAAVLCGKPDFFAPEIESAILTAPRELTMTFANITLAFENFSAKPGEGFTVQDKQGQAEIAAWCFDKNQIVITLDRDLESGGEVSFGWQADPTRIPVCDNVTYLPLLSFYGFPVEYK